jgi:hypothetical protein
LRLGNAIIPHRAFAGAAMKRFALALGMLVTLSGAVQVPNNVEAGFEEVRSYRAMSDPLKFEYVSGVIDGLYVSVATGAPERTMTALKACLAKVNIAQITAIVDKYVEAHPEDWESGAHVMVYLALANYCPAMVAK